jgi:hypothetical protein
MHELHGDLDDVLKGVSRNTWCCVPVVALRGFLMPTDSFSCVAFGRFFSFSDLTVFRECSVAGSKTFVFVKCRSSVAIRRV